MAVADQTATGAAPLAAQAADRLFEATPEPVLVLDREGACVRANGAARLLLEALPRPDRPFAERLPEAAALLGGRREAHAQLRPVTVDGRQLVLETIASPLGDGAALLVLRDVTRLVHANEALSREVALYETLLRAQSDLGEGVVVVERGRIVYANDAVCAMVGYTREEVLEMTLFSLAPEEERACLLERRARRLAEGAREDRYESVVVRRDGRRVDLEVCLRSLGEGPDARAVVILHDITERKRAQAELEAARRQVAASEKLSAMGGLVGGVAHEIRTPLTAIANHLSLIDHHVDRAFRADDPRASLATLPGHVAACMDGVERIARLVQDLRRFTRGETGARVRGSLTEAVRAAVRLFEATHPGRARVAVDLPPTPPLDLDGAQVQQVVINLLQNAADASPAEKPLRVAVRDEGDAVALAVEDEGVGIPPEIQRRMYEPFVTTKPEGTGLGLSIVRRLVELHGGTISCETRVGQGTRFTVRLPRPKGER